MVSTVSTIVIDPPEGHMQTYMDSLDRLARLPMSMLYPAHGPAFRDGQALVERYIDHRGYRQSLIEETLKAGSSTAEGLLPVVYADTDERMYPLAARSLLAGLEMLAERGKASEDGGIWGYD
jgi:glyoxylase-like metal-dependent hydrolase (beta-lactamase superfamily II)